MNHSIPGLTRRQFLLRGGRGIAALTLLGECAPQSQVAPATPTPTGSSLDEKIGQMIMVGFRGLELCSDNPIVQDIRDRHIGGVILFDYDVPTKSPVRNICSPDQLKALTTALQQMAATPLLIAVDQEGGQIARLKERNGFPPSFSQQYLGTLDDLEVTRKNAETMAQALKEAGINLNLAPVVDLNVNPDNPIIGKYERSFSADVDVVTRHALEEIKAHHNYGVLTTLKHFPGHGSSKEDSHLGFVDVTDTWSPVELEPYRNIINAGQADAVMTAHIFNTKLDPDLPATLSRPTITGILRDQLGFAGVIISDDMQMGAIRDHYGFETAVRDVVEAGVDILAFANNSIFDPAVAARAIEIIRGLVRDGVLSEERIGQSYARIMRLKARLP
jgi:beta-N-acetylhexosaminidase